MPQKALIIDDSNSIHSLIKSRFVDDPIEFITAHDGETGLRMARELLPDVILLDVEMPSPDGFEVCRRLQSDPATMLIPVIFLTVACTTEQKIMGLNLGAVDYVTKPFDVAELRARVRASLRTKFLLDLLSKKAMIDGLTGLWDRKYLDQRVEAETARVSRGGGPVSCIMCDVDHFKEINDRFGHPFGDRVLGMLAQTMVDAIRAEDVACRYGGEEFTILAPEIELAAAARLGERLRTLIESVKLVHSGTAVKVTCSFGVAVSTPECPDRLIERADAALYQAKRSGRNRVVTEGDDTPQRAVA